MVEVALASILLVVAIIGLCYSLNYQKNLKDKGIINLISKIKHFNGLQIPEGMEVNISEYKDRYEFVANGIKYTLLKEKTIDSSTKTDVEIQKQYVSSSGGALGGALMFGTLGALVGGRVKQKKSYNIDNYLIFTYMNENEPKFIAFECNGKGVEVSKLIKSFKSEKNTENVNVEL